MYAYRTLRIRIQTVQIHGDVTVKSFEYRMTDRYPEIRPDIPDPAVTISYTTPLSDSIKDNVVSACRMRSCIRHSKMMSQPRSVVFNTLVFTTDC